LQFAISVMRSHVRNAELLTVRRVLHTVNYIACIFDVLCNNLITSTLPHIDIAGYLAGIKVGELV